MVTPYYVPDTGLQEAVRLAALRGVVVDMILPETSNQRLADIARNRHLRKLAKAGVRIWLLPRVMVHAKALLVDRSFALAGQVDGNIARALRSTSTAPGRTSQGNPRRRDLAGRL